MTEHEIRIAAVKEFAERLWDKLIHNAEATYDLPDDFCIDAFSKNEIANIIDEIIEEMIKEGNIRVQLIELLDQNFGYTREMSAVEMADYLIENGVTIVDGNK